jgi:hypothetical protein
MVESLAHALLHTTSDSSVREFGLVLSSQRA